VPNASRHAGFSKAFRSKFGFPARQILGVASQKRFRSDSRLHGRSGGERFETLLKQIK